MRNCSSRRRWCLFLAVPVLLVGFATPALAEEAPEEGSLAHGIALFQQGELDSAVEILERVVQEDPDSVQGHFYLGLAHSRQERYRDAVRSLERAVELDGDLAGAHLALGIAHYRIGSHEEAVKALAHSLSFDPHNGSALFLLGLSHKELGDPDKAIPYFERAAQADPDYRQLAWYQIGVAHSKAGRPDRARGALERSIEVDPSSETADSAREFLTVVERQESKRRWSLSAAAGFEYDDNVGTSETDTTTSEGDGAGTVELSGSYALLDQPGRELEVGYDFFQSAYLDLEDFNLNSHSFSVLGSQEFWKLDTGLAYRFTTTRLGNERFLDLSSFSPSLGFLPHPRWYVNARWEFQNKNFHDNPGRDAHQTAAGLDQYFFFMQHRAWGALGYRLENENADRAEFDYRGHVLRASLHVPVEQLGPDGIVELSYQYTTRDYDELTPSIGVERDDRRQAVGLRIERRVADALLARLRYQYVDADSNLPSADYSQNVVGLSFEYAFQPAAGGSRAKSCPLWKSVLTFCEQDVHPARP
jgi:tetratricopeptide (TPR) repeat protein